jgi:hypothetical protein
MQGSHIVPLTASTVVSDCRVLRIPAKRAFAMILIVLIASWTVRLPLATAAPTNLPGMMPPGLTAEYELFGLTKTELQEIVNRFNEAIPANTLMAPKAYVSADGTIVAFPGMIGKRFDVGYSSDGRVSRVRQSIGTCTDSSMGPWIETRQAALYKAVCSHNRVVENALLDLLEQAQLASPQKQNQIDDYTVLRNACQIRAQLFKELNETDWAKMNDDCAEMFNTKLNNSIRTAGKK